MAGKHSNRCRSASKTYICWSAIKQRCNNANNPNFKRYGARGISYDPRWESYDNFLADMGEAPDGFEIDRIDNDGNYEKANCRWISHKANMNNRGCCRPITINGETKRMEEWAALLNMSVAGFYNRLRRKWPADKLLKPLHRHSPNGRHSKAWAEARRIAAAVALLSNRGYTVTPPFHVRSN